MAVFAMELCAAYTKSCEVYFSNGLKMRIPPISNAMKLDFVVLPKNDMNQQRIIIETFTVWFPTMPKLLTDKLYTSKN